MTIIALNDCVRICSMQVASLEVLCATSFWDRGCLRPHAASGAWILRAHCGRERPRSHSKREFTAIVLNSNWPTPDKAMDPAVAKCLF